MWRSAKAACNHMQFKSLAWIYSTIKHIWLCSLLGSHSDSVCRTIQRSFDSAPLSLCWIKCARWTIWRCYEYSCCCNHRRWISFFKLLPISSKSFLSIIDGSANGILSLKTEYKLLFLIIWKSYHNQSYWHTSPAVLLYVFCHCYNYCQYCHMIRIWQLFPANLIIDNAHFGIRKNNFSLFWICILLFY